MKKFDWLTHEVKELDPEWKQYWFSYYYDALENKEYWKLPLYIKGLHYEWQRDINNGYYINHRNMTIPIAEIANLLHNGIVEPMDYDINRTGKRSDYIHPLTAFHFLGDKILQDNKKYWSEETKKLYNIKEEEEMNKKVVLKKDFRGLEKGTELTYIARIDSWAYESTEEDISDVGHKSSKVKVQFSDSYVRSKPEVFEVPELEDKAKAEREQKIKDLESLVENTLEEINKLKQE